MAPDIHARYQRAGDLLDDVLAARGSGPATRRRGRRRRAMPRREEAQDIQIRLKARETPQAALLLALPQAAARPIGPLPVLRRSPVRSVR